MNKPYDYGEIQEITLQWQKVEWGEGAGLPGTKRLSERSLQQQQVPLKGTASMSRFLQ